MKKELIFIPLFLFLIVEVSATSVHLNPNSISGVNPGKTFDVDVSVKDVRNLWSYSIKLGYDPEVLKLIDAKVKPPEKVLNSWINTTKPGEVRIAADYMNQALRNGDVSLATITFQVLKYGETELRLYDTLLTDPVANLIKHEIMHGNFENIGAIIKPERTTLSMHSPYLIALISTALAIGVVIFLMNKIVKVEKEYLSR
jgi:hypothetical protein